MVGIVLVSHSVKLAEGVRELALQMAQAPVPVAIAAGIDDPENPFGTDVMQIQAAIESLDQAAGVVVLMDLGSAVMSAEMALEFLPDSQQSKVRLCAAPFIEGAIAAVVQAAAGAKLEEVVAEAQGALTAKVVHLSGAAEEQESGSAQKEDGEPPDLPAQEIHLTVHNPLGIHARPAAQLITRAGQFQADITVRNLTKNSTWVSAKSINQMVTLGVLSGHEIAIAAKGVDAQEALTALQQLVTDQFGDTLSPPTSSAVASKKLSSPAVRSRVGDESSTWHGIPASPGTAIGPVVPYHPSVPEVIDQPVENPQAEWQNLQRAIQTARQQIQDIICVTQANSPGNTGIFQAHWLYLEDPALLDRVYQLIFEQHRSGAVAWKTAIEATVATYQTLEDPYLQARAADVQDVGQRVLRLLTGIRAQAVDFPQPGILIAPELTPSDVAQLSPDQVLGIGTVASSATAHSVMIANMLGIPMVVGLGEKLLELAAGTPIALDGTTGQIWIRPDLKTDNDVSRPPIATEFTEAAVTLDGHKISLLANIVGTADVQSVLERGAEGVGLLRTELLYLDRFTPPSEAEQLATYRTIAEAMGTHPLTIRTVDIGGDKSIPYMDMAPEANPFLGWRGIRQSLDCPELLKTQLRAILRASPDHVIKVMLPMVSSVQEVRAAKAILTEAQAELRQAGIPFDPEMKVGIMVEVPAAVIMADQLAVEVDFFSIGTNDLSQYVMAADRTNPQVAPLVDALAPAVLRMIQQTVEAAHAAGIPVSVCGQVASDPIATSILLGLGVDALSVNPPAIAAVKAVISGLRMDRAEAIAQTALQLDSAQAVRAHITCS